MARTEKRGVDQMGQIVPTKKSGPSLQGVIKPRLENYFFKKIVRGYNSS
jgi:hypothetical protein